MAFYDLSKEERIVLVNQINFDIQEAISTGNLNKLILFFSNEDTYIRKTGYLAIGKLFYTQRNIATKILAILKNLQNSENENIRQTIINAAGEIGKTRFYLVQEFFEIGLFDKHHKVRNAVIGSIKKMGEKNPEPILSWCKPYLKHSDKEIRREICHGIELRGRTHPQDILPLLKELEFDETKRVTNTLVHVIGQIAYKNGCLKTVVAHLKNWKNKELVQKSFDEIVDVHNRYKKFAVLTQQEAIDYIDGNYMFKK
mgnify:CR=1 FL=1